MKKLALALTLACLLAPAPTQNAYIPNFNSSNVSVIDTATNTVTATIPVGGNPVGVAVSPDGSKVYITTNSAVSVIDTATNTVSATVPLDVAAPRQ